MKTDTCTSKYEQI